MVKVAKESSKPVLYSGIIEGGSSSDSSKGEGIKRKTPSELRVEEKVTMTEGAIVDVAAEANPPVSEHMEVHEKIENFTQQIGTGTYSDSGKQALSLINILKEVYVALSERKGKNFDSKNWSCPEGRKGKGEPYAPESFPEPGDQWEWEASGKRLSSTGEYYLDRYLIFPPSLKRKYATLKDHGHRGFKSRAAVQRFLKKEFPEHVESFFTLFKWEICVETEASMKSEDEELKATISKLIVTLDSLNREKEARLALETTLDCLREELRRAEQNAVNANEKVKSLEDKYEKSQEYNTKLQDYNTILQSELNTLRQEKTRDSKEDAVKQKEAVDILKGEQVREDRERQLSLVQELTSELNRCKGHAGRTVAEDDNLIVKATDLEMVDLSSSELSTKFEDQKRTILGLEEKLRKAERQLLEGEDLRKTLHNTIMELKGNIRVFCRVRPLVKDHGAAAESTVTYPSSVESVGRGINIRQNGTDIRFTFDKVFSDSATQEDVFMEISQLVQSALDGYKVCIFAFGQTGSGKTYTMMGDPEKKGLIPRSLEQVFQSSEDLAVQGWKYKIQASILEIYINTIRDLLSPQSSNGAEGGGAGKQHTIRHVAGNTFVSDLKIEDVSSPEEAADLLQKAEKNRSVGSTEYNERSSRSHLVITLRIFGVHEGSTKQVKGTLNLIDLAGSERLSTSGDIDERTGESTAINLSLTYLHSVLLALARKDSQITYRNCKLTHLLKPCLEGSSKTLMFVNVAPEASSVDQTLYSLRFATCVNSCETKCQTSHKTKPMRSPKSRTVVKTWKPDFRKSNTRTEKKSKLGTGK